MTQKQFPQFYPPFILKEKKIRLQKCAYPGSKALSLKLINFLILNS